MDRQTKANYVYKLQTTIAITATNNKCIAKTWKNLKKNTVTIIVMQQHDMLFPPLRHSVVCFDRPRFTHLRFPRKQPQ